MFVESAEAERGRYPWGKGLRVKRGVEGPSRPGRPGVGGLNRGRETPLQPAAFSGNAFSAPHTQPLSGPPLPRRQRRQQLFPPSRGPRRKRHPWGGGQASGSRPGELEMIPRPPPLSEHQTSPFPPLSLLYPPTSRPAGVRFDRPRNPLLLAASHPSQRPDAGEGPATGAAPEPAQVPRVPDTPPDETVGSSLWLRSPPRCCKLLLPALTP